MKKDIRKDDIYERKPDDKNRVSLTESDKVQKARKEGKKVELAVLGVVEDDE